VALFVMTCLDHKDGLAHRMQVRERHLAYAAEHVDKVKGQMIGSFFLMEVPSRADVEAFSAADPYVTEGVFASIEIHAFRATVGTPP